MKFFLKDEELSTTTHSLLTMMLATIFASFYLWPGARAIYTQVLEPMSEPESSGYIFGNRTLVGPAAVLGGWTLISIGLFFIAIAIPFTRLNRFYKNLYIIPILVGLLSFALYRMNF